MAFGCIPILHCNYDKEPSTIVPVVGVTCMINILAEVETPVPFTHPKPRNDRVLVRKTFQSTV